MPAGLRSGKGLPFGLQMATVSLCARVAVPRCILVAGDREHAVRVSSYEDRILPEHGLTLMTLFNPDHFRPFKCSPLWVRLRHLKTGRTQIPADDRASLCGSDTLLKSEQEATC